MKDIKSYVIGFLTCACLFLIMGQTKQEADANMDANMEQVMKMANKMKGAGFMPEPVGKYQISTATYPGNVNVMETTIDTKTGEIIKRQRTSIMKVYKKNKKP